MRLTDRSTPEWKKMHQAECEAADKVAADGGSPRAQLDAARAVSGERLVYMAHIGEKQARKNRERLAKKFLPCPICFGVEGCDHSLAERKAVW